MVNTFPCQSNYEAYLSVSWWGLAVRILKGHSNSLEVIKSTSAYQSGLLNALKRRLDILGIEMVNTFPCQFNYEAYFSVSWWGPAVRILKGHSNS